MNPPAHPTEPSGHGDGAAVAGLARELDELRRAIEPLTEMPERVDSLVRLVSQLAEALSAVTARKGPTPAPSWVMAPTDPDKVQELLQELRAWMEAVYLRYPDGAGGLPECWLWHPDVVEELLWLMHAWCAAYQGRTASVGAAGDWHDRQRPGVVRRIRASAGTCSVERHISREGWDTLAGGAPTVPAPAEMAQVAQWWASGRDEPAPEPAPRSPGTHNGRGRR